MAIQAKIIAVTVALTAAVEAATADCASAFLYALTAFGAMVSVCNGTVDAHFAVFTPFNTLLATTAATGARRICREAVAALGTMKPFFSGAFCAHSTVFTPLVAITLAFAARFTVMLFVAASAA